MCVQHCESTAVFHMHICKHAALAAAGSHAQQAPAAATFAMRVVVQFFRYEAQWFERSLRMRRSATILPANSPWLSLTNDTFLNLRKVRHRAFVPGRLPARAAARAGAHGVAQGLRSGRVTVHRSTRW